MEKSKEKQEIHETYLKHIFKLCFDNFLHLFIEQHTSVFNIKYVAVTHIQQ